MAVQAQYPSNAFSPDFRGRPRNDVLDELQMLQGRDQRGGSDLPRSEVTCNASGSKKRARDDPFSMALSQPDQGIPHQSHYPNMVTSPANAAAAPTGVEQGRMYGSAGTSTSGRPVAQALVPHLHVQSVEIDALVRLQTERLRSGLMEARKRHCRALLSALGQQVAKRLKEKETELECARRRNAELEDKLRQMAAEGQIWFNVAKNNEAVVSSLRATLEQVLLQSATVGAPPAEEGYGDSDGGPSPADDARSCCFEEEVARREREEFRSRRACRVCGEREVCVLLLPCRHLCLCKDCESKLDTCPVCHSANNASIQIFLS